jgi:glyceraldehyde-3-phosphate dehydrogenase/erythrose-4-phosphate dehydrogenase
MSGEDPRFEHAKRAVVEITQGNSDLSLKISSRLRDLVTTLVETKSGASTAIQQERSAINDRIQGFKYQECDPYREFEQRGWRHLKFPEYVSIASVLSEYSKIQLDRESKRRKPVLFKWMDDNWSVLKRFVDRITLVFTDAPEFE